MANPREIFFNLLRKGENNLNDPQQVVDQLNNTDEFCHVVPKGFEANVHQFLNLGANLFIQHAEFNDNALIKEYCQRAPEKIKIKANGYKKIQVEGFLGESATVFFYGNESNLTQHLPRFIDIGKENVMLQRRIVNRQVSFSLSELKHYLTAGASLTIRSIRSDRLLIPQIKDLIAIGTLRVRIMPAPNFKASEIETFKNLGATIVQIKKGP